MNRIYYFRRFRRFRRTAAMLGAFAASAVVLVTGATAAFALRVPPPPGPAGSVPQPVRVHTIVAGGMPGWQIALIAIGTALFAAALAVTLDRIRTAHRQVTASGA